MDEAEKDHSKSVESYNDKGQKTSVNGVNDCSTTLKQDETSTNSDSGLKYIQIIFYYVQDAALFNVQLPVDVQGENIIVKILEFSPEVLVSIYMKTVDLCFKYGLTAVTKVLAKSVFGYCVMLFYFSDLFSSEMHLTVFVQRFRFLGDTEIKVASGFSDDCSLFIAETCDRSLQFGSMC